MSLRKVKCSFVDENGKRGTLIVRAFKLTSALTRAKRQLRRNGRIPGTIVEAEASVIEERNARR